MEAFKKGFDTKKFEQDHFTFRRGSHEKFFNNWEEVRYEGGLSPIHVHKSELAEGNMSQPLYEYLAHVYGEQAMAAYFPAEPQKERRATLHFSPSSVMANGVGKQAVSATDRLSHLKGRTGKPMTDAEIEELAVLLCGSSAQVSKYKNK